MPSVIMIVGVVFNHFSNDSRNKIIQTPLEILCEMPLNRMSTDDDRPSDIREPHRLRSRHPP